MSHRGCRKEGRRPDIPVLMSKDDSVQSVLLSSQELGAEITNGSRRREVAFLGVYLFVRGR